MFELLNNPEIQKRREELESLTPGAWCNISRISNLGIKVENVPSEWSREININCFAYALNLATSVAFQKYVKTAIDENRLDALSTNSDFVEYLIKKNLLKEITKKSDATKGDIVIYFDENGRIQHASVVEDINQDMFCSRFGGVLGLTIFKHLSHNVLTSYGVGTKFYHRLTTAEAERYFLNYVDDKNAS